MRYTTANRESSASIVSSPTPEAVLTRMGFVCFWRRQSLMNRVLIQQYHPYPLHGSHLLYGLFPELLVLPEIRVFSSHR